ncbi:MAG TPA: LLM class flavin-dependent oxidoreductase [Jatrophihabitans sp.]|jgi:alkanesulfonate monooxygenase SsuD/methylene tetrahydromethanopterin reductase-like flavin-dependent oxidoreductase (luciferase family)
MGEGSSRPFRFGVVATPRAGTSWPEAVRRHAGQGYTSVLMPDGMQLPAPMPALAMAAASAEVTVGTWVLAAPLRPAGLAAWEAHSMTTLTGGRFEFGIGTGRPVVREWTERLGLPYGTPGERLAQVAEVVRAVRELDGPDQHTPVIMAAAGPRALRLAGELADIVTPAIGALEPREQVEQRLATVRASAGDRRIEFCTSLFVVGDRVPPHAERYLGADLPALRSADSLSLLEGTPDAMADQLQRRRDRLGTSYVTVNADYAAELAPVVELLTGR